MKVKYGQNNRVVNFVYVANLIAFHMFDHIFDSQIHVKHMIESDTTVRWADESCKSLLFLSYSMRKQFAYQKFDLYD